MDVPFARERLAGIDALAGHGVTGEGHPCCSGQGFAMRCIVDVCSPPNLKPGPETMACAGAARPPWGILETLEPALEFFGDLGG